MSKKHNNRTYLIDHRGPDRKAARWKIIQEVNKHVLRMQVHPSRPVRLRSMKDIQRCASHARAFKLVKPDVLLKAGFNPS